MILRASCGINYEEFIEFLDVITRQRMCCLTEKTVDSRSEQKDHQQKSLARTGFESSVFQDWKKSIDALEGEQQCALTNYCRYDLMKIRQCLVSLKDEQSFTDLENGDLQIKLDQLLQNIDTTLEKDDPV